MRGISLLEVLIAIFVILVGLLGVIALIPVGHSQMMKATQADRAATLGRQALANLEVQDLLNPSRWQFADGTDFDESVEGTQAFAIDPLYAAANVSTAGVNFLPLAPTATDPQLLPRLTLTSHATQGLAELLCMSGDDLLFDTSEDPEARPVTVVDANGMLTHKGEYSWMLTVNPWIVEDDVAYESKTTYSVSVAVFHRRDLTEREPTATVTWLGSDPILTFTGPEVPEIRQNSWVLIHRPDAAEWYRVVGVDESAPLEPVLSVAGPDWPTGGTPATAVLPSGAISVCRTIVTRR